MNITEFIRFKLINNSKAPTSDYNLDNRDRWRNGIFNCNTGIPTGSINNITVIDLDFYKFENINDNIFDNTFGKDYILNNINTFTVQSGRGGYHLYFNYDKDLYTTANTLHNIDIRNDKAYIVSPDSIVNSKTYDIINNVKIKDCPKLLKDYLLKYICPPKNNKKLIVKDHKNNNFNTTLYNQYNITKHELKQLIYKLPDKYWSNDNYGFLKFTSFCKYFDIQDIWNEINKTKSNYDYDNNINKYWNTCKYSEYIIDDILSLGTVKKDKKDKIIYETDKYINYYKYKPVLKNKIKPDITINKKKLGYGFIQRNINYVIKSDTGTGKTTSFKHYVYDYDLKFISIVSRVSLAKEQHQTFNEHGLNCKLYNTKHIKLNDGDNIVITIDSIQKLYKIDFSKYIIFLDEYNSLLKYLITNNNQKSLINKNRTTIYLLFRKIINECKQVICTDADINDISYSWIRRHKPCKYIKNRYKHNNNVLAYEIKTYDNLIDKLNNETKFMLCMDSKTQALILKKQLKDDNILLIMGGDDTHYKLDEYDKVIFTPKIVYGLDSSMKRNVYCYYTEKSIMPTGMIQQLSRCRNIDTLYYHFSKKKFIPNYNTYQHKIVEVNTDNILGCRYFKMLVSNEIYDEYQNLLVSYTYNDDCYKTNMFSHYRKLLQDRGFILELQVHNKIQNDKLKVLTKELKQELYDNFDIKNYKTIHKILNVPDDLLDTYKEYYIDHNIRLKHFNLCNYKYKIDEKNFILIHDNSDFVNNKFKSTQNKLMFLDKIKDTNFNILEPKTDINDNKLELYETEYKKLFRDRSNINFKNKYDLQKIIIKIYKSLFGANIVQSKTLKKPKNKNGQRKDIRIYNINMDYLNEHINLYQLRKRNIITPRLL